MRSLRSLLLRKTGNLIPIPNNYEAIGFVDGNLVSRDHDGNTRNMTRSGVASSPPVHASTASVTINPAGADNSIDYTAATPGAAGNDITIRYIISGNGSTVASVVVTDSAIVVTAGSTCTAASVITAVNAEPDAAALVTAVANGTVTGVIAAVAATHLTGGVDATVAAAGDTLVDSSYIYVATADVAVEDTSGWKKVSLSAL